MPAQCSPWKSSSGCAIGLIVWTQLGYAAALAGLARLLPSAAVSPRERPRRSPGRGEADQSSPPPSLSLIVAAHDEQSVIAAKVQNALALDYPRERLEVIVACDGCGDATAGRAREAGAPTWCSSCHAWRQDPRAGRRRRAGARRDRRVLRRQRAVGGRRGARARGRVRRPARRLRVRAGPLPPGRLRRGQPGGALLAL